MKRSVFLLLSLWEKKGGSGHAGIPRNTERGRMVEVMAVMAVVAVVVVGCIFFLFFSPSSNSILPRCPQLHPFREQGGSRGGVCACVCLESVGGVAGALVEAERSGTSCIVSPPAPHPPHSLTPCLPPPFSRDKECPECLASPAVSNN